MKTTLTIQESATLISKGVSPERASMVCMDFNGTYAYVCGEEAQTVRDCVNCKFYVEENKVFALADLLSLLPQAERDLGGITVGFDVERGKWAATYEYSDYMAREDELIDSLYKLTLHLIDNHVKLD